MGFPSSIVDAGPASVGEHPGKIIDDAAARTDWGWKPEWDLASMTEDMLKHLKARKEKGSLY